jgi:hypothetical protein
MGTTISAPMRIDLSALEVLSARAYVAAVGAEAVGSLLFLIENNMAIVELTDVAGGAPDGLQEPAGRMLAAA